MTNPLGQPLLQPLLPLLPQNAIQVVPQQQHKNKLINTGMPQGIVNQSFSEDGIIVNRCCNWREVF